MKNEYLYGAKRFINKIIFYSQGRSFIELNNDQISFDAICYCLLMLESCFEKLDDANFINYQKNYLINKIKKTIKLGEYINVESFDDLLANIIPNIQLK